MKRTRLKRRQSGRGRRSVSRAGGTRTRYERAWCPRLRGAVRAWGISTRAPTVSVAASSGLTGRAASVEPRCANDASRPWMAAMARTRAARTPSHRSRRCALSRSRALGAPDLSSGALAARRCTALSADAAGTGTRCRSTYAVRSTTPTSRRPPRRSRTREASRARWDTRAHGVRPPMSCAG